MLSSILLLHELRLGLVRDPGLLVDVVQMAEQLEAPREPLITLIARKGPLAGVGSKVLAVRELAPELAAAKVATDQWLRALLCATPRPDPVLMGE